MGWRPLNPVVVLERTRTGYRVESQGLDSAPYDYIDDYEAVAGFFAELYIAFIAANPELLCIHAAAMRWEGGLLVFPASGKVGKSTMAVHGAAAGATVFMDDVLAVRESEGSALSFGVAPRLRLPLPENVTDGFCGFLREREVLGNDYGRFVALRPGEIAEFGAAAPISAAFHAARRRAGLRLRFRARSRRHPEIVLLDRMSSGSASMEAIGKSEVLRDLMGRNFTQGIDAETKLQRLLKIAEAGACYRLRYVDCEAGIGLLREIA